jgi:acyl-CoA dehydrogenase
MTDLPFYDFLSALPLAAIVAGALVLAVGLAFTGAPLWLWTVLAAVGLYGLGAPTWLWIGFAAVAALFNLPPLRRLLSRAVLGLVRSMKLLPAISGTEKQAIDAGTVWVEAELFSGKPDFRRLLEQPYPGLNAEEQAFLDGPVEKVCDMTDDWEVFQQRDLPEKVWRFLKRERFFGMIIPEEYDGLGFGPSANSAVVAKLATVSNPLAITVMVPNSLGPAELLIHYGTEQQKKHYLPRLARGEEMPAFALTEPGAGSDAGSISSHGVVFRGDDGALYLRLNWNKRYITLAAVATVLGLAFKLRDPDNLLGKGEDVGITCALVPSATAGVDIGRRHDPMGVPFYNCPTTGTDVVVPLEEAIIGGAAGAGQGWRMLMESLAAGRGISLPALAAGGTKAVARIAGAHALVRKQFGLSIGRFEGIEEPLARIGGFAYLLEAARRYTCGGLDQGAKPAVVTAMAKHYFTELSRKALSDGMDVLAGNAISRGPRNLLSNGYVAAPIAITVEGANILTRTLMIFGQGAIRCHPFALREIMAVESGDVAEFDRALWGHLGHVVRNGARALLLSLTRGALASSPTGGPAARYYRKLAWCSASFAFLADLAMGVLGGDLKRKEKITGRFADIFSWMYLASAVLRRFEAEGRRKEDLPFLRWSMDYALGQCQEAFDGLFKNLRPPVLGWLLTGPVAAWSRVNRLASPPSDALGARVARALQVPGELRERLTAGVFQPADRQRGLARLEHAFELCYQADRVVGKLKKAIRAKRLPKAPWVDLIPQAVADGVLDGDDAELLRTAEAARDDAIQVDSFSLNEYLRSAVSQESPEPAIEEPAEPVTA